MPDQESPQIKFKIITLADDIQQAQPKEVSLQITKSSDEKPVAEKLAPTGTELTLAQDFQISRRSPLSAIGGKTTPPPIKTTEAKTQPEPLFVQAQPLTPPSQPIPQPIPSQPIPSQPRPRPNPVKIFGYITGKRLLISLTVIIAIASVGWIYSLLKKGDLFRPRPAIKFPAETPTPATPTIPIFSPPAIATPTTTAVPALTSTSITAPTSTSVTAPTSTPTTTAAQPTPIANTSSSLSITPPPIPSLIQPDEEPPSPKMVEPIQGTQKEITSQGTTTAATILALTNLPKITIPLSNLTEAGLKQGWLTTLRFQRPIGTLTQIEFNYQNQPVPVSILIDYLIKPRLADPKFSDNLKQAFAPRATLVFYYSYTRKFPLFIVDLDNDRAAVPLLRLWDKNTMIQDLKPLYTGLPAGKFIRNYFVSRSLAGVDYRIAFTDRDYKLIWTVYNKKLIISTSLLGFETLLKQLQQQ